MTVGIICEYNPFHNGHLYQLKKAREMGADKVVCVMSGNFVQRGECAYFDKWFRAECAVKAGADVVLELPLPWSMSSAENFAFGAVSLLSEFGIEALSFGSEYDDAESLRKCAEALEDSRVVMRIRELMAEGKSYPASVSSAVSEFYGEECAQILSSPNSTLGVEYIRALNKISPDTKVWPVKRIGAEHDGIESSGVFASASKIRSSVEISDFAEFIPKNLLKLYSGRINEGYGAASMKNAERSILSSLREMEKQEYLNFVTDETGLAQRIYKCVKEAASLEELTMNVKSKNYTLSRVRREILNLFLRVDKEFCRMSPPYIKILSVNGTGLRLLGDAAARTDLPIITRNSEASNLSGFAREIFELQCKASDKYGLFADNVMPCGLEQSNSIKIIR